MPPEPSVNPWRTATFALVLMLLLVLVAWVTREQGIRYEREQEQEQWDADREAWGRHADQLSRMLEQSDVAADEAQRNLHHQTTRPTTRQ